MGTYLNPGLNNFIEDKQRLHYIDKTLLIKELNNKIDIKDKFICSSRPRRFGKTMAANMIAAYYSKGCDSHEIFSDLKISTTPSFENHINKYNVIALDMNVIFRSKLKGCTTSESVDYFVIPELRKAFP
ncbi:MAG: AAA family ATPase, partial [Spirochaetales bacterium]|nr:AAA family ATPase [Spirochaetales bacterium]